MPIQLWVSAIEVGLVFALVGLAYLVILEGAGFFNFALGPTAMFSGMTAAFLISEKELNPIAAVVIGIAAAVVLGLLSELLVVRPIEKRKGRDELAALVAVVALLFAIEQFAGYLFGFRPLPGHAWLAGKPFMAQGAFVSRHTVVLVVVTLLVFVLVWVWLRYTDYGKMLRAVGDNRFAANLLGLPVGRIRLVAFALAGLIAGIAGPLASVKSGISFQSGLTYSLAGFLAIVVGGTGSAWGPLAGGLLVALLQTVASYHFGGGALNYVTLALALVFFSVRPQGIFTRRVRT
jgi:branched-chain amino acid transport system permease protein